MAAECLFNRNPTAVDYVDRTKLLFGRDSYQEANRVFSLDSQKFRDQQIHQKIEVGKVDILKPNSDTVLTAGLGKGVEKDGVDGRAYNKSEPGVGWFQVWRKRGMGCVSCSPRCDL